MKFTTTLLAAALAVLPAVRAHGTVSLFTANGKTYSAPDAAEGNPFTKTPTPVRQLLLLEPITDLNSTDMICGRGTPPKASEVATIAAGSEFSFAMRGGSGAPWPHTWGGIQFYVSRCPGSAAECDQSNLKWFKIGEKGLRGQNSWYQADLQQGKTVSGTIPSDLESGDYLLRIEIMALHNAMRIGGAEASVSCTQLHVTGGGSAVPSASDLVTFPGAYKATDPGILVDIWNNFTSYEFPGPAVFKASSSGSAPAPSSSATTKPTASAPINAAPAPTSNKPSSTSVAPSPTKTACKRSARHRRARALINHAREFSPAH